ncbi:MAG: AMP-binding protein [Dehalococcoidia bacterium]|jgi:fatty-acyl-CoA synthase
MLLFDPLEKWAREIPEKEALVYKGSRVNYAEYNRQTDRVARGLLSFGVKRGDKVAIWMPNRPEYNYCYLACAKVGAVAVPISIRFTAPEAQFIIHHSDACALLMDHAFGFLNYVDIINSIRADIGKVKHIAVLGEKQQADKIKGAISFDNFLNTGEDYAAKLEQRKKEVRQEDTVLMLFTSGTTGRPKSPELTHDNITSFLKYNTEFTGLNSSDRALMDLPNNHAGGSTMAIPGMLYVGGTLVIHDGFVPLDVLKTIHEEKITYVGQVPTQYILMLMQPDFGNYDMSSLRLAVAGAAPVPPELVYQVKEKMGVTLTVGYGLTESTALITFTRKDDPIDKIATTIGMPLPGVEIKIKDDHGNELPRGETGEICIGGRTVMKGYYNAPDLTAQAIAKDGFLNSQDIGFIDNEGYLHILGRKREMYIRGGENVFPPEIEDVLYKHPKVMLAAVLGYPDPVLGEKGRAYIVPKSGMQVTEKEIREFSKQHLAKYKVPDAVIFRDSLPLTPLGKVHKFVLYEEIKKEFGK